MACAVLVAPSTASAATGGIAGEVTEFTSGNPVPEARVCVELQSGEFEWTCALTASDGTYSINGLAPGSYTIEFSGGKSGRSFLPHYYDDREIGEHPVDVTVGSGIVTGIDGHLKPGGGIGGRVTESAGGAPGHVYSAANGQPLAGIPVCLYWLGPSELGPTEPFTALKPTARPGTPSRRSPKALTRSASTSISANPLRKP